MIFYFSGTGNSLYVAQKLYRDERTELVDIAKATHEKRFEYKVEDAEKIGFVFPVYFYGLPTVVTEFVDKLTIESSSKPFIYTVITCAAFIGNADKTLGKLLEKKNLQLNSSFSVTMPNNYNIMSNLPDKEKQNIVLQNAEKEIEKIAKLLKTNTKGNFAKHGYLSIFTPIVYPIYGIYRNTKKFYATQDCNNCGSCAKMCPEEVIQIKDGKPVWVEEKCSHCSACINRCPTEAIQYGNSTMKRRRYVNPNVKFS
ncbi:MAG TPA: EFR1 family ferrodoxin [Methanobacteriaceae archaeon]|nr:EFR1 family ferrodoxin [Methanobacteriaceae archaeon]